MFGIIGHCRNSASADASLLRRLFCVLIVLLCLGAVSANAGLFSPSKKPSKLLVFPPTMELRGAGDVHGLLVTAVMADGSQMDVTDSARFISKQPNLVAVTTNGLCRPVADGTTQILVEYSGRTATVPVAARNSGVFQKASFRQDVLPVLTRSGCNAGGCHGKLAGQNGFKLSLRGFAPDWDYGWLTTEVHARRIDYAFPDESLVILKATGQVPHEGGQRFAPNSRYHQTLVNWIAARAPGPLTNEVDSTRIEVSPGTRTMKVGETQRLLVRAHYPDGRARDVTWLTQFFSNDETVLSVSGDGRVKAKRAGETSIRAHFQGHVEVVIFTVPYENKVNPA